MAKLGDKTYNINDTYIVTDKDTKDAKNNAANGTQTLTGVDKSITDTATSTFNASNETKQAQAEQKDSLSAVKDLTGKDSLVSQSTWDTLNSQFVKPSAVQEADVYIQSSLEKIQSGKTSYSDQVRDKMNEIMGRDKFSYDVDSDPLFQQALASSMNSGKSAMQDTIGQASALTGGYGSSYATTAGNQAYNAFIEDAYNNLPQYYQMALEAYQMEGDELYRQLGMLNEADTTEYSRLVNAFDATSQYRNRMYDEAYTMFRDSKTDAVNIANLQLSEHGQLVNDAMTRYNATSDYASTLYGQEFDLWNSQVNQAMQWAQLLNQDAWQQTEFDEGVRQYEKNFDESVRQYEQNYAQTEDHFTRNQTFQSSEAEKERTFKASEAQKDRDLTVSENALNRSASAAKSGSGGSPIGSGLNLSTAQYNAAKEAWDNAKGGDAGFEAAVRRLEALGVTVDETNASILYNALESGSPQNNVATGTVSQFRTTKGDNFNIKVGDTYYGIENHGKVKDGDTLKSLNTMNVKNNEAFLYNGDAYVKYADGYYKVGAQAFGGKAYQGLLKALQK